jgi:isopentenyl-diphosphate delta-isomerase
MFLQRFTTLSRRIIIADAKATQNFILLNKRKLNSSSTLDLDQKNYDKIQLSLLNEECILVNGNDEKVGSETKKNCHLIKNINNGMLHRAFSVFLFNNEKRLLMQQRSKYKITYPLHWTNSCCSHPLNIDNELDESQHLGIKRAARRRLNYELGIDEAKLELDSIQFLTKIHYRADNIPSDGVFAEHEIDYVLFIVGDFELNVNKNEIESIKYLDRNGVIDMISEEKMNRKGILLTPWFKLITEEFLFKWWDHLDDLKSVHDQFKIHRFV